MVREASRRVLGLRPFDVQLIGGIILHVGQIAEMRTGEGKTLVAVLPAYLNALSGKGVQVPLCSRCLPLHTYSAKLVCTKIAFQTVQNLTSRFVTSIAWQLPALWALPLIAQLMGTRTGFQCACHVY